MTTATAHRIASWEERGDDIDTPSNAIDSIATESQPRISPEWDTCIDALLALWQTPSPQNDTPPNRQAIESSLEWLYVLRAEYPSQPPTWIAPEPAGGIIIERRSRTSDGVDWLNEFTFYNNGVAENTVYRDSRIVHMGRIPARPHRN